jgi:uncharacterized protein YabN with tetrapyrrole methylase and pyrophosphatase domain
MPSLTVVGMGIQVPAHVTAEALTCLETADEVLYLLADPVAGSWVESVNPNARSLHHLYRPGVDRDETYSAVVDEILESVRRAGLTCAAFYGHAGVFVNPSHVAIRRARDEGFEARMLPGISADACLFADLGIDPAHAGCQSYEATEMLLYEHDLDPTAALVIWQVGVVGNITFAPDGDLSHVPVLVDYLLHRYPPDHPVVLYEASTYAICGPAVETVLLGELAGAEISAMATLYLEPLPSAASPAMEERLGLGQRAAAALSNPAATTLPFNS